ncbi:hypothetical protein A8C56_07450 [Niabella ginsenosidivorans]|uniref:Uncharacterized protein n=1 Tax=Niabella ginsenosidivorans TaxID=1176587 RepID=A0A1A9HZL1_9BACT|nr:hypothetical protein A8C56_07450 [Niabella ginsenosidivorans]
MTDKKESILFYRHRISKNTGAGRWYGLLCSISRSRILLPAVSPAFSSDGGGLRLYYWNKQPLTKAPVLLYPDKYSAL